MEENIQIDFAKNGRRYYPNGLIGYINLPYRYHIHTQERIRFYNSLGGIRIKLL